jgi:RNA polymerase sigma factor (sigma-70 family)
MDNTQFEKLILENEKFVYSIVHKEFKSYPWDIKEDLFSAGKEGLVVAATKYKPDEFTKNKFTTYAQHWIRYYINEEIYNVYDFYINIYNNY